MAFNIKINKVEDVEYIYNNENQYNHEDNQNKQINVATQEGKTSPSTNAATMINNNNNTKNDSVAANNSTVESKTKENQKPTQQKKKIEMTEEIQKVVDEPAAPSFKEIEVGFVVLQEEAEEGENVIADEPGQFMKKAKQNVFSKNVTIKEDFKQLPLSEIEKPQQSGGCCGGKASACNIF